MAAVAEEEDQQQQDEHDAGSSGVGSSSEILNPSFPMGRVKKIMKLDRDIKKINSEALLLVSLATELFLGSLAGRARDAALAKKRRIIKLDHLRSAVRAHPPTSNFLLDCLPKPPPTASETARPRSAPAARPTAPGARRIEDFFGKPSVAPS